MTFDLIIKNGTLLDGIADEGRGADIGISGGKIAAIDNLGEARAAGVFEAYNAFVAPGFVDSQNHSDSYFTLLEAPTQGSTVAQGITTISVGHCGTSLAPLPGPDALRSIQKWRSIAGANINWLSFAEYYNVLEKYPLGVNLQSFVGHSTLRRGLVGDAVRSATPEEIKIMEKLIRDSFSAGAGGVSMGLVYAHEVDSSAAELESVARLAAEAGRPLSVHLRSEGGHILEAIDEVIGLAEKAGAKLHISHFKIRGKQNWTLQSAAIARLDQAYQKGIDVWFDVYPYSTSSNVLYTYLPKWAYEGGRSAILQNIQSAGSRARLLAYLSEQERSLGDIFIASSETNPVFVGKTLAQVAANQEVTPAEALLTVLTATQAQAAVFDHNLDEKNVEALLRHPLSVVATDGAGYDFAFDPGRGLLHPRCFGAMPKFLGQVRDRKLMSWSQAIKKISSRPAEKLGLKDRGRLVVGAPADLVVFDPRSIGSKASYENPYIKPDGIELVLVGGKIAFRQSDDERQFAGKVLRS